MIEHAQGYITFGHLHSRFPEKEENLYIWTQYLRELSNDNANGYENVILIALQLFLPFNV